MLDAEANVKAVTKRGDGFWFLQSALAYVIASSSDRDQFHKRLADAVTSLIIWIFCASSKIASNNNRARKSGQAKIDDTTILFGSSIIIGFCSHSRRLTAPACQGDIPRTQQTETLAPITTELKSVLTTVGGFVILARRALSSFQFQFRLICKEHYQQFLLSSDLFQQLSIPIRKWRVLHHTCCRRPDAEHLGCQGIQEHRRND